MKQKIFKVLFALLIISLLVLSGCSISGLDNKEANKISDKSISAISQEPVQLIVKSIYPINYSGKFNGTASNFTLSNPDGAFTEILEVTVIKTGDELRGFIFAGWLIDGVKGTNDPKLTLTLNKPVTNIQTLYLAYDNFTQTPTPGISPTFTATRTATATKTPLPSASNIAKGKAVTVSSQEGAGYEPSRAVDGNSTTRWASAEGVDPQWIYVDLGSVYSVSKVILKWEAAYAKAYKIQVSNDKTVWTDKFSTTTENGGTDTINLSNTSGRYVRMFGTERATDWGYSLYEMEVYGNSNPTPTTTPSFTATVSPEFAMLDKSLYSIIYPANTSQMKVSVGLRNSSSWSFGTQPLWITFDKVAGNLNPGQSETIIATIDWSQLPDGLTRGQLNFTSTSNGIKIAGTVLFDATKTNPVTPTYTPTFTPTPTVTPIQFPAIAITDKNNYTINHPEADTNIIVSVSQNATDFALWGFSTKPEWLSFSKSNGTLGPGQWETITATVNWSLFAAGETKTFDAWFYSQGTSMSSDSLIKFTATNGSILTTPTPTPSPTVPQWTSGKYYAIGDIIIYNGVKWICKYPHTANEAWYPGAPGLWFWEKL